MAAKRSPYDFYPTPESAFEALYNADRLNWCFMHKILEPCAGDGNLVRFIKAREPQKYVWANELDKEHQPQLETSGANHYSYNDFLTMPASPEYYNMIITNPPFSLAQPILEKVLDEWCPERAVMLLRLNFLASQRRKEFWQKHLPSCIYVLSKRPSFTGSGTDSQDYAWFVWDKTKKYDNQILVV